MNGGALVSLRYLQLNILHRIYSSADGCSQSLGWEHYEVHEPEPHILLFKYVRSKCPRTLDSNSLQTADQLSATRGSTLIYSFHNSASTTSASRWSMFSSLRHYATTNYVTPPRRCSVDSNSSFQLYYLLVVAAGYLLMLSLVCIKPPAITKFYRCPRGSPLYSIL